MTDTKDPLIAAALSHLALKPVATFEGYDGETGAPIFNYLSRTLQAGDRLYRAAPAKPGYLTAEQITAGAAVACDHGQAIGRNVAIDVFDAMSAAGNAPLPASAASAVRTLLLELTTLDAKLVDGSHLAQRANAILAMPQEGAAP